MKIDTKGKIVNRLADLLDLPALDPESLGPLPEGVTIRTAPPGGEPGDHPRLTDSLWALTLGYHVTCGVPDGAGDWHWPKIQGTGADAWARDAAGLRAMWRRAARLAGGPENVLAAISRPLEDVR
jgi:hypothetical protein